MIPNTTIHLLASVPLEPTYQHTINFSTQTAQYNYFYSKKVKTFERQSYQRQSDSAIQIQAPIEDVYYCNYLMFKNNKHDPIWFYAFITNVEYINEVTTKIYYQLDVIQTWLFSLTPNACLVVREHVNNDTIGLHTVPEGLETGQMIERQVLNITPVYHAQPYICLLCSFDRTFEDVTPRLQNGVYSVLMPNVFLTVEAATSFVNEAIDRSKTDGIIGGFMVPSFIASSITPDPITGTIPFSSNFGGYTPKNNKLKCYPYNYLDISTNKDRQTFKWEYCSGGSTAGLKWSSTGYLAPAPASVWRPTNYATNSETQNGSDYRMTLDDIPQIAISVDLYKLYLADQFGQDAIKMFTSLGSSLAGAGINAVNGAVSGGPAGAAAGGGLGVVNGLINFAGDVANMLAYQHELRQKAPEVRGTMTSSADFSAAMTAYRAHYMSISEEYAKIIDGYFTMFGYKVNTVKEPQWNSRQNFNYIQCIGSSFVGNAPASIMADWSKIFDNGITFWKNPENIGNYNVENNII